MSLIKFQPDFDRFHGYAENGASSFQCFLSAAIVADSEYPNRMVEALKWALISELLGDEMGEPIVSFLTMGMNEIQIEMSFDLAEKWVKEKIDLAMNPDIEPESLDWTHSLQELTGLKQRKSSLIA